MKKFLEWFFKREVTTVKAVEIIDSEKDIYNLEQTITHKRWGNVTTLVNIYKETQKEVPSTSKDSSKRVKIKGYGKTEKD